MQKHRASGQLVQAPEIVGEKAPGIWAVGASTGICIIGVNTVSLCALTSGDRRAYYRCDQRLVARGSELKKKCQWGRRQVGR